MPKPRILWIPHTSWTQCRAQRPWFLIQGLSDRFEIHVATWAARPPGAGRIFYANPLNILNALRARSDEHIHQTGVPLPLFRALFNGYPSDAVLAPAQWRFQTNIRRLHKKWRFDALVASASHHFTGYPPSLPGVPCLFDYVDTSPEHVEKHYVESSAAIVTVSKFLQDRVRKQYGRESIWIPNGLHVDRIATASRERGRAQWNLDGRTVVSLIGLTCSERLYFLDALAQLRSEIPNLIFVAAGGGTIAGRIAARAKELGLPVLMTGWLEHDRVPDLFAASDVGLYPGEENIYYDGACPLKVLEYAGAGVPVVASRSAELQRLGFENMIHCGANAGEFAAGIRAALKKERKPLPSIAEFDWSRLCSRFGDEIERLITKPSPG